MQRTLSAVLLIFAMVCASSPFALAADFSSPSFLARDPVANDFGGTGTSTNFEVTQSGGDLTATEASSTNFVLNGGPMFFETYTPKTQNWRWYDDETNETPSSALANENVAPVNVVNLNLIKLRVSVAEVAAIGAPDVKFRLQFSTSSNFSESVHWVPEAWECTGGSGWCYADGAGTDNAVISTKVLTDADACSGGAGTGCGTHNESGTTTSSFTHEASAVTEYEFTILQSGAIANTVYFFRLFDVTASSTVPYNTGESYPSIVTEGAALTFAIGGLDAATTTEGVTTDITTTPSSVPFGSLAIGSPLEAAHRLTVSTNSERGYKIYAFQRQTFQGNGGDIDPVSGTNASPSAWASGCTGDSDGCYGYHTGEDVLEGGSTRFAANDTFAQFTGSPQEIAYSGGPATNKKTDIVYKVEAHTTLGPGDYSTNLVYIVTPVF